MSKTAQMENSIPAKTGVAQADLPFEEALAQLESIVKTMESADLPLEQMLAQFEQGAQLAKICQNRLAAAEIRVRQLEKNLAGEWETRPVEFANPTDLA